MRPHPKKGWPAVVSDGAGHELVRVIEEMGAESSYNNA